MAFEQVELAFNLGPILISNAVVIGIFAFGLQASPTPVNLTDGLDGLATGLNIFTLWCLWGHGA